MKRCQWNHYNYLQGIRTQELELVSNCQATIVLNFFRFNNCWLASAYRLICTQWRHLCTDVNCMWTTNIRYICNNKCSWKLVFIWYDHKFPRFLTFWRKMKKKQNIGPKQKVFPLIFSSEMRQNHRNHSTRSRILLF
jgi:hypothetical protein